MGKEMEVFLGSFLALIRSNLDYIQAIPAGKDGKKIRNFL